MDTRRKILSLDQASARLDALLAAGKRVVAVRGLFDVLTRDHAVAVGEAASGADFLVALVYADSPARPTILDERSRAQLAAALGAVDCVLICDQDQAPSLVDRRRVERTIDIDQAVQRDLRADVLRRHGKG